MSEYLNITSFLVGFSIGTTLGAYLMIFVADRVARHRRDASTKETDNE